MTRADIITLVMIFGPMFLIVALLLWDTTRRERVARRLECSIAEMRVLLGEVQRERDDDGDDEDDDENEPWRGTLEDDDADEPVRITWVPEMDEPVRRRVSGE